MLIPTATDEENFDRLPFARGQWFVKFNLSIDLPPSRNVEHFFNFKDSKDETKLKVKMYYFTSQNVIFFWLQQDGVVSYRQMNTPVANQIMDIEARSGYSAQSDVWEWEAYVDGVRKAYVTTSYSGSVNDVYFAIGPSSTVTITDLKYSLTEPCGKVFPLH